MSMIGIIILYLLLGALAGTMAGLFGIGGIRPYFVHGEVPTDVRTEVAQTLLLAPVPWLPDAPRGASVASGRNVPSVKGQQE